MAKEINALSRAMKTDNKENFTETFDDPEWEEGLEFDVGEDMHGEGEVVGTDEPDDPEAPPKSANENFRKEDEIEAEAPQEEASEEELDEMDKALAEAAGEDDEEDFTNVEPLTEKQQQIFNRKVAKARREGRGLEEEVEKLRQQVVQQQTQPPQPPQQEPTVPPLPDRWDPEYDQKVAERDQALQHRAQWDAHQRYQTDMALQQQTEQQNAMALEQQATFNNYRAKAAEQGIDQNALAMAEQRVVQAGTSPITTDFLQRNEYGAKVTMFLNENPNILATLNGMHPNSANNMIASKIVPHLTGKGKVSQQQRQQSANRPKPSEVLRGGGRPELRDDQEAGEVGGVEYS